MKSYTITFPQGFSLSSCLEFSNQLGCLPNAEEYIFDFAPLSWIRPFELVFLSNALRTSMQSYPDAEFRTINFDEYPYAAHMGFYQACGFEYGKYPGEATGSETYLPITILSVDELKQEMNQQIVDLGQIVEQKAKRLAQILTREEEGDLVDMLTYAIREVIRNAVEHSQSPLIEYCAQYWPKRGEVEIAILDVGIGIRKSLSNNPYLEIQSDRDALNPCLMPGISGKVFKGIHVDPYDPWQNSGFGLYLSSRLCGNGGKFFICSGDTGLKLSAKGKEYLKTQFSGTALRLILSTKKMEKFKKSLGTFCKEGDEIAKQLTGSDGPIASTASKMLWSEFGGKKE